MSNPHAAIFSLLEYFDYLLKKLLLMLVLSITPNVLNKHANAQMRTCTRKSNDTAVQITYFTQLKHSVNKTKLNIVPWFLNLCACNKTHFAKCPNKGEKDRQRIKKVFSTNKKRWNYDFGDLFFRKKKPQLSN